MAIDDILLECEDHMDKTVDFFLRELRGIRTGRASAGLVDHIKIDYYGAPTELRQLAAISVPEPDLIAIKPFDPSTAKGIEKAILASDLGITPVNDGKIIRLPVPTLSGQLKQMAEQARVAVRNVRRDANKTADKEKANSLLTEDDVKVCKEEVQKLTDEHSKKIDAGLAEKTAEILED